MKVIVTGVTGTAGSDVLKECLADPDIEKVTALSRRALPLSHPKLKVLLLEDFLDYSKVLSELRGHDACLWCLGVSQNEVGREEYHKITFDYTLAGARAMASVNPKFTFCFLSGEGADSNEKSRILFARVKGMTENALDRLGRPKAYHFRPGYIHSTDQPKEKRKIYDRILAPIVPLLYRLVPGMIINTKELAKAMVHVARNGSDKKILGNNDIRNVSRIVVSEG